MIIAILILLAVPFFEKSNLRGLTFRPIGKLVFWFFVGNFLFLMFLGGQHVEEPYIFLGQIATGFYFFFFIVSLPLFGILENKLAYLNKKR